MKDLSMHILDIAENSVKAGADRVEVELLYTDRMLQMAIRDNGCGMDEQTVGRITDPYTTSRSSRKVGLGLPFLKMNAEQTGGRIEIDSKPGKGTGVTALFDTGHIDCVPEGDLASTLALLMTGHPEINFVIRMKRNQTDFEISSDEIKEVLEGVPISHPKVGVFVRNMIKEEIKYIKSNEL
ncbi:ATP-binding protein [Marinilabilia salmonicolor]|jgi:signal transduction histidine kinase|uniref:histidine kinase n=1 Tax=Marinilabilia salmonicolor TaxID=989 RepID=A0A2T0XB39_9BACT|nr:ATP-binding protein [Marinilabilia salmonicolor]PRY96156.1 histidine kinase/DNA gyrase B/HSP90-like ATPase [Marinilabilia salmonicolor]RCW35252.1 histidine kinase/DNA gyrase B/HSP90-like ATPase [Marinilabilia salmonicolor]